MNESMDENLERLLCRYLDGDLSRRERLALEKRLAADEALRAELQRYAALDGYLGGLGEAEVDGVDYDLQRAEIVGALEKKVLLAPPRRRPIVLRPVFGIPAAAAAILLLASGAVFLLTRPGPLAVNRTILVEVLPPVVSPAGAGEIFVQISQPSLDEMPLTFEPSAVEGPPSGTIVVSVGSGPARKARAVSAMVIY